MVLRLLGTAVTDANGLAVLSDGYTGTGAGLVDIIAQATIDESTVVSQPYEVLDCIYYDPVTSDTTSNYYINTSNVTKEYSDGYIVITSINTGTDQIVDLRSLTDDIKGKTVNIEVEIDTNEMTGLVLRTVNLSPSNASVSVVDGVNKLENVVIPSDASNLYIRIVKTSSTSGNSFKFKNLKVYPV